METRRLGTLIKTAAADENGVRLEYRLYRSDRRINGRYSYSLEMIETSPEESDAVYAADVSRRRGRADEMFSAVSRARPYACTFLEVIEDLLE